MDPALTSLFSRNAVEPERAADVMPYEPVKKHHFICASVFNTIASEMQTPMPTIKADK